MIRILITLLLVTLFSAVKAQGFDVDTLLFSGDSDKRINYVILGDGYLESELTNFIKDAEKITNDLLSSSPFLEYENYLNIFTISVPSNESGAALDPSDPIDNYFGSTFNFAGIERLLVPVNTNRINTVLANNFPLYDQAIIVVNSDKYGGSGGAFATASTNESASEITIHEIGHSFARLSDEYWAGAQFAGESPNMTRESSTSKVKWNDWVRTQGVGIYPHSGDNTWFRPHTNCKMEFLGAAFCPVCKQEFISVFHQLISSIDTYSPVESTELEGLINFNITTVDPKPNTLKVVWYLDNEPVAENQLAFELMPSTLSTGVHTLETTVYDSTSFDRNTSIYISTIKWRISSEITSDESKDLGVRPLLDVEVITSTGNEVSGAVLSIYPNPFSDKFKITYESKITSSPHIQLLNIEGKVIKDTFYENGNPGLNSYEMDLSGFESGVYFVKFNAGSIHHTFRLLKKD